jgi:hypothetical protein
LDGGEGGNVW